MTSNTITASYPSGYRIAVDTLTNRGTIFGTLAGTTVALYGSALATVTNIGVVNPQLGLLNIPNGLTAISLHSGGVVTNRSGASVTGGTGINSAGAATIANYGRIRGNDHYGVTLSAGGFVTNASGALISGNYAAVEVTGGMGVVLNAGTLTDIGSGIGVGLAAGGSVANTAGGSIAANFGILISGGTGTVTNAGSVSSRSAAVQLDNGGTVTNTAGRLYGNFGVAVLGAAGTVTNAGSVEGSFVGVALDAGGTFTNAASGTVVANSLYEAVRVKGAAGTVFNAGVIRGGGDYGVYLKASGLVTNAAGASITDKYTGVDIEGPGGTVANAGIIVGTLRLGVYVAAGGVVSNAAGGSISGKYGVDVVSGTFRDAGAVIGTGGTAVIFEGTLSNLLVLSPGASFTGLVVGGTLAGNGLELATGASTGTITGVGTQFLNFGSISFDPNAHWFLGGNQAGLKGPILNFAVGDTIEVTGIAATGSVYAGGTLTLSTTSGPVSLALPGAFQTNSFVVSNMASGVDVTLALACFRQGTHLLTASGPVPVEALRVGDLLVTGRERGLAPVTWLGKRRVDDQTYPDPRRAWPIRIRAEAFGPGEPGRDLWLSPDHAVYANGVLIPVHRLVNGTTVTREPLADVTYWHVELPRHDILLAEGLTVESYLNTGDRASFEAGTAVVRAASRCAGDVWEHSACAPLVLVGLELEAVRSRVRERALAMGFHHPVRSRMAMPAEA